MGFKLIVFCHLLIDVDYISNSVRDYKVFLVIAPSEHLNCVFVVHPFINSVAFFLLVHDLVSVVEFLVLYVPLSHHTVIGATEDLFTIFDPLDLVAYVTSMSCITLAHKVCACYAVPLSIVSLTPC